MSESKWESEWKIVDQYRNQPPGDIDEFKNWIRSLYEINPDESLVTLSFIGAELVRGKQERIYPLGETALQPGKT